MPKLFQLKAKTGFKSQLGAYKPKLIQMKTNDGFYLDLKAGSKNQFRTKPCRSGRVHCM